MVRRETASPWLDEAESGDAGDVGPMLARAKAVTDGQDVRVSC